MRILLADDEPVARQVLRELLEDIPGVEIAGEAADGLEAADMVRKLRPDTVLLDLEMPGMNGFQVARGLDPAGPPALIFVTAYEKYALEALDAGAVDYVLKPVRKERLAAALAKARALLAGREPQRAAAPPRAEMRKIAGRLGQELHLLDPEEVIAFQAEGELVYVLTARGRYYATHTLRALEERLPAGMFRRIHRSTIINTGQIRKIAPLSSKRWLLTMANGLEVVVSKRSAGAVREAAGW
jgi:DNA-binding LytR/AlgR family response regulator